MKLSYHGRPATPLRPDSAGRMAGCRGDGVPYSQLTNGSNISVGDGCRA
jgi:hypothetical protein